MKLVVEGRVTVSNNFTKRRQNGSEIGTRDKFATHLRQEIFISNEIVIYTIFLGSVIFSYNSLYTQAVAYTTYFELGEPVCLEATFNRQMGSILMAIFRLWRGGCCRGANPIQTPFIL